VSPFASHLLLSKSNALLLGHIKPTLLNHPKHITYILDHDSGDVGDGVDVVFGVVGEAGAGHEVEVFEDGVETFADAVVEFAQWGVAVDEQDGVVGGELGHWGEAAGRGLGCHGVNPHKKKNCHLSAAKQMGGSCAWVRRPEDLHQDPADPKVSHAQPP